MQSEIWFREDIVNALRAVGEAGGVASVARRERSPYVQGYCQGFVAALRTMRVAFGLDRLEKPGQAHVGSLELEVIEWRD